MKIECKIPFMKFIFSSICCLLLIANGYSQSIQVLEEKLQTASAEDKPGILNQLSEVSLASNPDKSIDYAERALKAARKTEDVNEEAEADVNLANGHSQSGNLKKSISYLKDAIKVYEKFNQKASTAVLWNKISI